MELRSHDMYGHEIVPLGETGFGVSTTYGVTGSGHFPMWTFFHVSDGFRQCLFMLDLMPPGIPAAHNVFPDRCVEVSALMQPQEEK